MYESMTQLSRLIKAAGIASHAWLECDEALAQVNESHGMPYEAARKSLNSKLLQASSEEFDLDQLKGKDSPFIFPDPGVHVIVRVHQLPAPTDQLAKARTRREKAQLQFELAKKAEKDLIAKLAMQGHEFHVEKVTTAFKRTAK